MTTPTDHEELTGHTPGPWTSGKETVGSGQSVAITSPLCQSPIALVWGQCNADLIASAPSILAENKRLRGALENAIDCFSNYIPKQSRGYKEGCFNYITDGVEMGCSCPICKARAALEQSEK